MHGKWKVVKQLKGKWLEVQCEMCGYTAQKLLSSIKTKHRCPSVIDGTKYCYKCQTRKSLDFFWKDPTVSNGYSKLCKDCWIKKAGTKNPKGALVKRRTHSDYDWTSNKSTKTKTIEHFLKQRQNSLKYRHLNKNMGVYNLPDGYLYEIFKKQNGRCFYTGIPLDYTVIGPFKSASISVDKLIPKNGYTVGNIVLCLMAINTMKNDMTVLEFKEFLKSILGGVSDFVNAD